MSGCVRRGMWRWTVVVAIALSLLPGPALAASGEEPATAAHDGDWQAGGNGWDRGRGDDDPGGGDERDRGRGWDDDRSWQDSRAGRGADWSALAAFAANNGGHGFWVLTKAGQVFALEGAPDFPAVQASAPLVAMASHPTQEGFWLLDTHGNVHAVGAARDHGSAAFAAVGIAAHRSGAGYWVVSRRGKVAAFGQAVHHGDLRRSRRMVDRIVARDEVDGYYLHTAADRWVAYPRPANGHGHGHGRPDRDRPGRNRPDREQPDREKPDRVKPDRPAPPEPAKPVVPPPGGARLATVRGVTVARAIAPKLRRMLSAADRAGMRIGGWGYRSTARQIELRRQHCGTSRYAIYEMPSSQCRPPTARPGHSMHESGRAIDFYKRGRNGQAITISGTREFRWLKRNAARFGFYNLPSEPWHWSTNGR